MPKDRAQCLVVNSNKVLMVNHVEADIGSYWCLPGGGIEPHETPEEAALRELREECCVDGEIVRRVATVVYASGESHHTFECRIVGGTVSVGGDPEFCNPNELLRDAAFVALEDLTTADLCFLCQAGALALPELERPVRVLG